MYDTNSAADIGTLYQARNYLNARSVPSSPMKDINATEELIQKYSETLILTAFEELKTTGLNAQDKDNEELNKKLYDHILVKLLQEYVFPAHSRSCRFKGFCMSTL